MPGVKAIYSAQAQKAGPPGAAGAGDAYVTRVHFTAEDLARTRFCSGPAPLMEAALGLEELRRKRPGDAGSRWLRQARRTFPATARPLLAMIPPAGHLPHFLHPLVSDLGEGMEMVRATPRRVLREQLATEWQGVARSPSWLRALADGDPETRETVLRGLRDFHATCVAPHWPGIVASFCRDVTEQVRVLAAGGLAGVFAALHEDLAWRDGSLERRGRTGEYWLDGDGLQFMPSALWSGPPVFTFRALQPGGNALIYPARPAGAGFGASGSRDLAGLMGRRRAAVLEALRDPCGTAELAARLAISAPSASEHATALRSAGLVQTLRCGRGVRHSLTPLGRSLLNGP